GGGWRRDACPLDRHRDRASRWFSERTASFRAAIGGWPSSPPAMSAWTLSLLCMIFLLGPWVLMPRRRGDSEIRGVLRLLWALNAAYCAFLYRLETEEDGFAPLPEHGPAILIANHTCPADSMLLQATSRRVLGFLIAREYY